MATSRHGDKATRRQWRQATVATGDSAALDTCMAAEYCAGHPLAQQGARLAADGLSSPWILLPVAVVACRHCRLSPCRCSHLSCLRSLPTAGGSHMGDDRRGSNRLGIQR